MRKSTLLFPAVIVVLVGLLSSVFIVDEREKALVLQFGQIVRVKEDPGLSFKIPLIQEVVTYDDRILSRDLDVTVSKTWNGSVRLSVLLDLRLLRAVSIQSCVLKHVRFWVQYHQTTFCLLIVLLLCCVSVTKQSPKRMALACR